MSSSLFSSRDSRFLAAVESGVSLNGAARIAGFSKESGYSVLRRRYLELRRGGLDPSAVVDAIGASSSRMSRWEQDVGREDRHHSRAPASVEAAFWLAFEAGADIVVASRATGASRASAYRWVQHRFNHFRDQGLSARQCAARLRLTPVRASRFEQHRLGRLRARRNMELREHRLALASAAEVADRAVVTSEAVRRRERREHEYWQLMRAGVNNSEACRLLGVSRRTGGLIRKRAGNQIPALPDPAPEVSRYLDLRERLQLADLHRLGVSLRGIAAHLGRHPSTISRELRRHCGPDGAYLPHTADHDARRQRLRPKEARLATNDRLRLLVQRKLNRCWSPEEISGWLRRTHADDRSMQVCHETIYRALLLREDAGLHKRYAAKLRTGRRIRKTRWRTRSGQGSRIRNMAMIDTRPEEAAGKLIAGHWEGDLIIGVGSVSAMLTLRERKTQYGLVVNLPVDHTAATVNMAITKAFAGVPKHLKRSLTWDQGVEMASHEALTATTGVPVFFAERSSPWQRGANENFNGLLRQYFPKGTDLARHSDERVDQVVRELNTRPRKLLDYDTPASRFRAETIVAAGMR
jgi:IS30 family transposase